MIKLVAFDWNGTLLDDLWATVQADNEAMRHYGLPPLSVRRYQQTFRVPIVDFWQNLGLDRRFYLAHHREIEKRYAAAYELLADRCRPRAGAGALLNVLARRRIGAVIYSNHTVSGVARTLRRLHLADFFDKILARMPGDYSHTRRRSKEQKLAAYAAGLGLAPAEIISLGDTEEEIDVGRRRGYHTVAIGGGWNTAARLRRQRPDFFISRLTELSSIIKRLNR
ncbi:MAG TPA: HAD family hydrolase [Patescibacteria group bacterium]|nr:HAD family hydrolase [Patescibacteria group bacterium]